MKAIRQIVLVIFSIIILIIGVCVNLLAIGWVDLNTLIRLIQRGLVNDTVARLSLLLNEIFMVLALLCIFIDSSDKKQKYVGDVLMQNDNGKLMISKTTIENLVNVVIKDFPSIKEANTRIQLDNENNVLVMVELITVKGVVIKELTVNLQNKIKTAIKNTSDLEVKEVDVRIKDIINPEEING